MPRSKRYEFTPKTKRLALERSGGRCEAIGEVYGLRAGERCNAPLEGARVEFDHYPMQATQEGSNTLENCVVMATGNCNCHAYKTAHFDIPVQAKIKRIARKRSGDAARPKTKIAGRGFQTNRNSKFKRTMSGKVERRNQ